MWHLQLLHLSVAMAGIASYALQDKELSTLHKLLGWLPFLNNAPPNNGIVIGIWHPHYPL
jgi:hypothetical protein